MYRSGRYSRRCQQRGDVALTGGCAKNEGLGKPWEEPGKEEPDSQVEQMKITKKYGKHSR
jgi:hypothetical protein